MSLSVTLFGPRHYFWRAFKDPHQRRVWFYWPDQWSTGGVGFCVPGLHVCFTWGRTRKEPPGGSDRGAQWDATPWGEQGAALSRREVY